MSAPFLELQFKAGGRNLLTLGFGQTLPILMDWRPAFREMAESYAAYEERVFATEGRAGLGKWKALSPRYAAWKAVHFPGMPIGTRTGRLRAGAGTVLYLGPDRLAMGAGSLVPYGKHFERHRPFVRPNERQITVFREIARRHLVRARQAFQRAAAALRGR